MELHEIAGAMRRLELLRKIRVRAAIAGAGLHAGQPMLLEFIGRHPGCAQRECAEELDVTAASAAVSLKRLEKAGLVRRQPDPQDARCNRLYVTAEGERRIELSRSAMDALDSEMFSGIDPKELEKFKALCEKMFDNLADESTRDLNICKLHRAAHDLIRQSEEET